MPFIKTLRALVQVALCVPMLLPLGAFAVTTKAEQEQVLSHDGLQKISVRGVDLAFARPGATLAGYHRVKLDPVEVSFSKNWDPKRTGSVFRLNTEEREGIRSGLIKIVQEEFIGELQRKGSYQIVNEAGPDVLRVSAHVVDVYVNAPDTMTAGRSRTYTLSAGEATIYLELFDSETGQVLFRMVDRREARSTGSMSLSSSVTNVGDARDVASAWARILRNGLDQAHGIGHP
jgi:Protein of unknown function (DUF3313)